MKYKFERLSKEEKKEALKNYKNSNEKNAIIYKKFRKLETACLCGLVFGIGCAIFNTIYMGKGFIYDYILDAIIIVFCITSYVVSRKYFIKEVNDFIIKKK